MGESGSGAPRLELARARRQRGTGAMVGMADVEQIHEACKVFGQMDNQFGAGLVRPVVVGYLDRSVTPLLRGRYDDRVGSALMSAAAGMSWLAGWTAFDSNRHGQAQQHFGQALQLAKTGNDSLTGAWVLATLARQAIHLEQATWAPWLARAATDTARQAQASPRVMALMLSREAWATALRASQSGNPDRHTAKQVERLITEAERAYAQGASDRDPEWVSRYEEAELRAQAGRCWSMLGEHRRAVGLAEAAVTEYRERIPRTAQFNQIHAAEGYAQGDQGAAAGDPDRRSAARELERRVRKNSLGADRSVEIQRPQPPGPR